ncbi:MAG: OmpA family protein [Bacteroidota bacterium]
MWRCRIRVCARASFLACILAALAVLGPAVSNPAAAQWRSAADGGPAARRWAAAQEGYASRMLADAQDDLAHGRASEGRRRLEILVARYPETDAAVAARGELGRLYAREQATAEQSTPAREPTTRHWPSLALSPADPRVDAGGRARQTPAVGAERSNADRRVLETIEQDFRLNVGDRVFFGAASAELGARARAVLAAQAQWLKRYPGVSVVVEGHADEPGTAEYNRELGLKRAQAVRARLIAEGVEEQRVNAASFGREQPVATCPNLECAPHNRRAVTAFSLPPVDAGPNSQAAVPRAAQHTRPRIGN